MLLLSSFFSIWYVFWVNFHVDLFKKKKSVSASCKKKPLLFVWLYAKWKYGTLGALSIILCWRKWTCFRQERSETEHYSVIGGILITAFLDFLLLQIAAFVLEAFFAEMEMNASEKSSQDDSSSDSDKEVSYQDSLLTFSCWNLEFMQTGVFPGKTCFKTYTEPT